MPMSERRVPPPRQPEEEEQLEKGGIDDAPPIVAEPPPPSNKLVAAADEDAQRKTPFSRLWNWLQVLPPLLPLLTDLDRAHDGTLDVRQNLLSGRFMSAKLEAAYVAYILAVWRPRLRAFLAFLTVVEAYLLIKSLLCSCGLRFATYEGWARVYSFAFLMAVILAGWLILSPKLARYTSRMMPWLIPFMVVVDLLGFAIPLALYLGHASPDAAVNNASLLMEDAAAMKLMQLSLIDQGAWFTSCTMTFTLFTSIASVTFGVGAYPVTLLTPVAISCYLLFERKRFGHQYGIEPSLVPQAIIVYALCTILTFCLTGSTRQQFILRIYVQHERDLRVEQLEQEKERLDYERRFALVERHSREGAQQSDTSSASEGRGVGISFVQQELPRKAPRRVCKASTASTGSRNLSSLASEPELSSLAQRQGGSADGGWPPRRPCPRGNCALASSSKGSAASSGSRNMSEPEPTSLDHAGTAQGVPCQRIPNQRPRTSPAKSLRATHGRPVPCAQLPAPCSHHHTSALPVGHVDPLDVCPHQLPPNPLHDTQRRQPGPDRVPALGSCSSCAPHPHQVPVGHGPPGHGRG